MLESKLVRFSFSSLPMLDGIVKSSSCTHATVTKQVMITAAKVLNFIFFIISKLIFIL